MSVLATRGDVARLFGRAAFGATRADLDRWTGQPYVTVVDSLFPPGPPGNLFRLPYTDETDRIPYEYDGTNIYGAQRWWLERMRTTPYPLEERMTLFWHDHFATAYLGQPDVGMLMVQNQTLRMHALGNFRTFASAMTVDPAMLVWLNGIANRAGGVNENYAREFFELFTLGVLPQVYTETDIREAARVFTGFVVDVGLRQAQYVDTRHDLGRKTVLGRTIGGFPAGDPLNATEYRHVTEAALDHDDGRTVSRFLAYKLVLTMGYQPDETNLLADPVIQDVAAAIRANDAWDLRAGVRALLLHDGWRYATSTLVRSPIEIIVHGAKILGFPLNIVFGCGSEEVRAVADKTGQVPLQPPNVGGWPTGHGWLSQTMVLGRYDLLTRMVTTFRNLGLQLALPFPASGDIAGWASYMGLAGLSANTTVELQSYLANPGTLDETEKQIGMFILVGTSPDWQVM